MAAFKIHTNMYSDVALDTGQEYTYDYVIKQIKERINLYKMVSFEDSDPIYYSNYQNYVSVVRDKVTTVASNNTLLRFNRVFEPAETFARRDSISHIMIRFACQIDYEKVFLNYESKLFYLRLQDLISDGRLDQSETSFVEKVADVRGTERISPAEFQEVRADLAAALKQEPDRIRMNAFMKVKFLTVPKVVSSRRCVIRKGWVYCSVNEYKTYIVDAFKKNLIKSISYDKNVINYMRERNQDFSPVHKEIFNIIRKELVNLSSDSSNFNQSELKKVGAINLNLLYEIMNASKVPPCIKYMYESMRSGHLKHMGRFMLGSFLKGIGVEYNDADVFMRQEFSRSAINNTDFDKKYKYYFRHVYGLEGSKKDYNVPQSCKYYASNGPTSPEQAHGCPFKHLDSNRLRSFLKKHYITNENYNYMLNEIVNNRSDYMQSCTTTFNYSHFVVKQDDLGREINGSFRKDEVTSFPVRFCLKALEYGDIKVNPDKYYHAFKKYDKKAVQDAQGEQQNDDNDNSAQK